MTTTQIVSLILGSSVLAGIASAFTQIFVARNTRKHATSEREADQEYNRLERLEKQKHEQVLRREAAHDLARDKFLHKAEEVQRWLDRQQLIAHQEEDGSFFPPKGSQPVLTSAGEALDRVSAIQFGHPTRRVRLAARELHDAISIGLGDVDSGDISEPAFDDWSKWELMSRDLIEEIHTPEGTAEGATVTP